MVKILDAYRRLYDCNHNIILLDVDLLISTSYIRYENWFPHTEH